MQNPWQTISPSGHRRVITDATEQLALLGKFDEQKLQQIVLWPGTARPVKIAAQRRLHAAAKQTQPA